jgi:hypothetical protein
MSVKILRLKNGDDIIGDIYEEDMVTIFSPMVMWMDGQSKQQRLLMDHYLPVQVIKENMITIKSENILGVLEPSDELVEYYHNSIDELNSVLHAKEVVSQMSDDEIIQSIVAMRELEEETIH